MDTNVDALKNLYIAFGGSSDTVADMTTNADVINALATLVSAGGGSILPAVTTDDNGKVLKVADGAWAVGTDSTGT
jgi:hypothetical protein